MNDELLREILLSPRLPTPPSIALQVIDLVQNPSVRTVALASTVGSDPALAARVLRTANSSFYAQARTIRTISEAIVLLGLNTVRTLALGFSLVDTFRSGQVGGFNHDAFWHRSVTVASAARAVAAVTDHTRKEEAFLAGLMLKIGVLALHSCLGDRYTTLFRLARGDYRRLIELEHEQLDLDHIAVGAALSDDWHLPTQLTEAIRYHLSPDAIADGDSTWLVRVSALGEDMANAFTTPAAGPAIAELRGRGAAWFGFSESRSDQLLADAHSATSAMRQLFDLPPRSLPAPETLLSRANEALMTISLQTSLEASRLAEENRHLAEAASTDMVTGLSNRRHFDEFLEEQYRIATRYHQPFSVAVLDLDNFKLVNDSYGHGTGDLVLNAVAEALRANARSADLVARIGGDEFAVVMPATNIAAAHDASERLRLAVERTCASLEVAPGIPVTVSIGIAELDAARHGSPLALLADADHGLYAAKSAGRNRVGPSLQRAA